MKNPFDYIAPDLETVTYPDLPISKSLDLSNLYLGEAPELNTPDTTSTRGEDSTSVSSTSNDLDFYTYLSHQQGVSGLKQIRRSAEDGRPLSPTIQRNIKNNVYEDFKGPLNAKNFLEYWRDKWQSRYSKYSGVPSPYEGAIQEASKLYKISPEAIRTAINIESQGDPNANKDNPNTRYKGLLQLDVESDETKDIDVYDPRQNILRGVELMARNRGQL